jgi:hypothetical protein
MTAQTFQTLRGTLTGSGTEGNAVSSSDLGILISEQSGSARSRQCIIDLYDHLRPSLRAYLRCLGMKSDQAEDIIQDNASAQPS